MLPLQARRARLSFTARTALVQTQAGLPLSSLLSRWRRGQRREAAPWACSQAAKLQS